MVTIGKLPVRIFGNPDWWKHFDLLWRQSRPETQLSWSWQQQDQESWHPKSQRGHGHWWQSGGRTERQKTHIHLTIHLDDITRGVLGEIFVLHKEAHPQSNPAPATGPPIKQKIGEFPTELKEQNWSNKAIWCSKHSDWTFPSSEILLSLAWK